MASYDVALANRVRYDNEESLRYDAALATEGDEWSSLSLAVPGFVGRARVASIQVRQNTAAATDVDISGANRFRVCKLSHRRGNASGNIYSILSSGYTAKVLLTDTTECMLWDFPPEALRAYGLEVRAGDVLVIQVPPVDAGGTPTADVNVTVTMRVSEYIRGINSK